MRKYCQWLANEFTIVVVLVGLFIYICVAVASTISIRPNITPKKLFLADSLINEV
jgi:hypothetical protein